MSKLHEALSAGVPEMEVTAIREWMNERGEMGVYREQTNNDLYGQSDNYVLAVLLTDGRLLSEGLTHNHLKTLLEDASILAAFAEAKDA